MKKIYSVVFVVALMLSGVRSHAQEVFHNNNNVAINGYDVVSYFTDSQAVQGKSSISTEYRGATFYFANEAHKKAFTKSPEKYMPQYDGYCAYAVGNMNAKVPTNPETFKIVDGKLYLFFNDLYDGKPFNTLVPWNADEDNLLSKANTNWETLKDQK